MSPKHFTYLISFNPHRDGYEVDTVISVPMLQIRKMKHEQNN